MRRAFTSFLTIILICVGVFVATTNQHSDRPQVVSIAATTAPPGSISHPFQFTLTAAFAPLGPWLDGVRHAHDVGVMEEAAIYKAQHTPPVAPRPTRLVSSFAAPGSAVYATGSVNGYPCGGALPACCTLTIESHGTPTAQNPRSSASGLWQFLDSTWHNVTGLPGRAADYSAAVQNAAAAKLYAGGAGWGNWKGDHCYPGG